MIPPLAPINRRQRPHAKGVRFSSGHYAVMAEAVRQLPDGIRQEVAGSFAKFFDERSGVFDIVRWMNSCKPRNGS